MAAGVADHKNVFALRENFLSQWQNGERPGIYLDRGMMLGMRNEIQASRVGHDAGSARQRKRPKRSGMRVSIPWV
jgi:hypothetical protein